MMKMITIKKNTFLKNITMMKWKIVTKIMKRNPTQRMIIKIRNIILNKIINNCLRKMLKI
jgi:hypothetical protein